MATKLLLPGFGGAVDLSLAAGQTSDAYDCSLCESLALLLTSEIGTNSGQPQQSFDGVTWASLGGALAAAGNVTKLDITDKPFGLVRVVQTGAGSGVFRIVGFRVGQ